MQAKLQPLRIPLRSSLLRDVAGCDPRLRRNQGAVRSRKRCASVHRRPSRPAESTCSAKAAPSSPSVRRAASASCCAWPALAKSWGWEPTLSGEAYEVTAELLDAAQVVFVKRKDLLKFLRDNPSICMEVVRRLSDDLHGAYERVRSIGLNRARRARVPRGRRDGLLIARATSAMFRRRGSTCSLDPAQSAQEATCNSRSPG